jgi:hypothetical protein
VRSPARHSGDALVWGYSDGLVGSQKTSVRAASTVHDPKLRAHERLRRHPSGRFHSTPLPIVDEEARRSVFEWLCWVVPLLITEACLSWVPAARVALKRPSNKRMQPTAPMARRG